MNVCFSSSHPAEDEEIEEVHDSQDNEHHADFYGEGFDTFLGISDFVAKFERHADVAEVDKVEANDKQVIDRIREGLVAVKDVDQEDATVLVKCLGDPDSECDAYRQVDEVGCDFYCHGQPP